MENLIQMLNANYVLHWLSAILGIISIVFVRLFRVRNFKWKRWFDENMYGLFWSLFFLSISVTMTAVYSHGYSHLEAYLTGYCGTHIIFRLNKEPKPPLPKH
jgi:ABC-type Mn2+/Zn2+ transport system permease subunit